MTTLVRPDPHWRTVADALADRIERRIGVVLDAVCRELIADALQQAAESQWGEAVIETLRRIEDDRR